MKHLINLSLFLFAASCLYSAPVNVAIDAALNGTTSASTVLCYGLGIIALGALGYRLGRGDRELIEMRGYRRGKAAAVNERFEKDMKELRGER